MNTPKERPILFTAAMVRANLNTAPGVWPAAPIDPARPFKSQARRLVKPQPVGEWAAPGRSTCPHGVPGQRLWTKEAARVSSATSGHGAWWVVDYAAGGSISHEGELPKWFPSKDRKVDGSVRYCSPFHLPRWASRHLSEIVSVRIERIQSITEADARAEGLEWHTDEGVRYHGPLNAGDACPRRAFLDVFYNIKKRAPIDSNPFVWVIEYRRLA